MTFSDLPICPEQPPLPSIAALSNNSRIQLALQALESLTSNELCTFVTKLVSNKTDSEASDIADTAFFELAQKKGITSYPTNYASTSVHAMQKLQNLDKPNLLVKFAICISEENPETGESLMPLEECHLGFTSKVVSTFPLCCSQWQRNLTFLLSMEVNLSLICISSHSI